MDACTDVFVASTDQSHWRQEIVIWVSIGLAIAHLEGKFWSSCGISASNSILISAIR